MFKHAPRLKRGELAAMTPEARKAHLVAQANRYYTVRYKKRYPKTEDGFKVCRRCQVKKPETVEFFPSNKVLKSGLNSYCRACINELGRQRRARTEYGMSREEYEACFEGARCAICSTDSRLVMDHCHSRGVPRGILCNECNTGLGMFRDEPHRLEAAAAYLRNALDTQLPSR